MNELTPSSASCIARIREILAHARAEALKSVNAAMVAAYWQIGREIVEEEQRGRERANYGARLLHHLSMRLTDEFGKGFGERNLRFIRQFYQTYADRSPPIRYAASTELAGEQPRSLSPLPSWTHYRVLMRVSDPDAHSFYPADPGGHRADAPLHGLFRGGGGARG